MGPSRATYIFRWTKDWLCNYSFLFLYLRVRPLTHRWRHVNMHIGAIFNLTGLPESRENYRPLREKVVCGSLECFSTFQTLNLVMPSGLTRSAVNSVIFQTQNLVMPSGLTRSAVNSVILFKGKRSTFSNWYPKFEKGWSISSRSAVNSVIFQTKI